MRRQLRLKNSRKAMMQRPRREIELLRREGELPLEGLLRSLPSAAGRGPSSPSRNSSSHGDTRDGLKRVKRRTLSGVEYSLRDRRWIQSRLRGRASKGLSSSGL